MRVLLIISALLLALPAYAQQTLTPDKLAQIRQMMKDAGEDSGLPGETIADKIVAADVLANPGFYVKMSERAKCKPTSVKVVDTKLISQPIVNNVKGDVEVAWDEEWTVEVCDGKKVTLPIGYLQNNRTGTTMMFR